MASTLAAEKRQHVRLPKSCEIEFRVNNETYRGISDNFSVDGILIMTDNLPALYSVVSITVHLPAGATSHLKGRVRRVHKVPSETVTGSGQTFKGGMGVEIIERDSNYIKFFMKLLGTIKF